MVCSDRGRQPPAFDRPKTLADIRRRHAGDAWQSQDHGVLTRTRPDADRSRPIRPYFVDRANGDDVERAGDNRLRMGAGREPCATSYNKPSCDAGSQQDRRSYDGGRGSCYRGEVTSSPRSLSPGQVVRMVNRLSLPVPASFRLRTTRQRHNKPFSEVVPLGPRSMGER
jgi:hypothetical protein